MESQPRNGGVICQWDAYNITFTQTGWGDRVGVALAFDKQEYTRGGFSFLGGSPTLTMDILMNRLGYYNYSNANGVSSQTNANYGRPYVLSMQVEGEAPTPAIANTTVHQPTESFARKT